MTYQVTLQQSSDGNLIAACPELPGCIAKGRTEQEALHRIKDAITAWMWDADLHAPRPMQLPMAV